MSIGYQQIKRLVALKSSQLIGTNQATLEAAYTGATFGTTLDGAEVPATAIKDAVLMIEKELAHIIASDPNHPYRSFLYARTAALADLASIPIVDNAGVEIIGVWDSCSDASTNKACTWMPEQTIQDIVSAATYFGTDNLYYYNTQTTGNYIRHTRTSVFLQGCSWSQSTQATAYDANGNSPLPTMLANTWVSGVLASLPQVGWVDNGTLGGYAGAYQAGIEMLRMASGQQSIPLASTNTVTG